MLSDPLKDSSRAQESWSAFLTKLRTLLLMSFTKNLGKFEDDMRTLREKRTEPGWSFCDYFMVQVRGCFWRAPFLPPPSPASGSKAAGMRCSPCGRGERKAAVAHGGGGSSLLPRVRQRVRPGGTPESLDRQLPAPSGLGLWPSPLIPVSRVSRASWGVFRGRGLGREPRQWWRC